MKLWQMLLARRGLMDVAEAHERGGAGGVAADNEQSTQDPDKQGEQKEQPKGDDEYAGMTHEELLVELRKTKKAGAELLKENMKRKEKERTLADQLAQYGDIDPVRARQLLEAEQAAENARREAEQAELERRGEFDAVKKQMIEAHQAELAQRDERYAALESERKRRTKIISIKKRLFLECDCICFMLPPFKLHSCADRIQMCLRRYFEEKYDKSH